MIKNNFLLKSIIYRACGMLITFSIALLFTNQMMLSGGIAIMELIFKTGLYYIFEIIWNKITTNKMKETIWFNGLSGAGKTTIGNILIKHFEHQNKKVFLLDGDVLREGLNNDLGFTVNDRIENLRRAAEVAKILNKNGIIVISTFITPTNEMRETIQSIIPNIKFVHLLTSIEECEERDVKGLYKKARAGEIKNFTGIDSPFEDMENAWLKIDTSIESPEESAEKIIKKLES